MIEFYNEGENVGIGTLIRFLIILVISIILNLAGGGVVERPLGFVGLKFLPLDQLQNGFAQLFLDNEDMF